MVLKAVSMAELREQVLLERERSGETVAEICARWETSPASFYRWKARWEARGAEGLEDLPRTPFTSPRQIPFELEDEIVRMRKTHERWGARRIRAELIRAGWQVPACSTVHRALVRNGLVLAQPRKRPRATRRFEREVPNDLWQIDVTKTKLTTGAPAEVIDVLDDCARYLLGYWVCHVATTELAWKAFRRAADRHGLPRQLLSDNGLTFTGRLHRRVVGFERELRTAGVQLINSKPRHPETLGKLERFHRTLKEWLADEGPPRSLEHLVELLGRFEVHYNTERPHQALGEATTPAERYLPSATAFVEPPPDDEPAYPAGALVRSVAANGVLTYGNAKWSVGARWAGRRVRVVDRGTRVDFFYGPDLVRSAAREPGRTYYPLPERKFPGRRSQR